jgi:hypothetical protein
MKRRFRNSQWFAHGDMGMHGVPCRRKQRNRQEMEIRKQPGQRAGNESSKQLKDQGEAARRSRQHFPPFLMSVEETAEYLRISVPMVRIQVKTELPTVNFGTRILVVRPLLDEMLVAKARKRLEDRERRKPSKNSQF